jgi:hypothetical protein
MRVIGSGDDDELNFLSRQQVVQISYDSNVRIFLRSFAAGSVENGAKVQTRHGANYGRVKRAAGKSEPDKTDLNHGETIAP